MIEPPPCFCHHRNDVLHGEIGALEIDREDVVPARFAHLDDAADLGDADIVVEHVDAAIGLQARRHHRLDLGFARDVGGESGRLAALAGDDIDGLLGCRRVAVDAKHLRALARKGDGGRLAIAPAGTDRARAHHHRRLALEPFHRLLLPVVLVSCSPGEAKRNPGSCWQFPGFASLIRATDWPDGGLRVNLSDKLKQAARHTPKRPLPRIPKLD